CTDPVCFAEKVRAHNQRQLDKAASDGAQVLSEEESVKFLAHGSLTSEGRKRYIDLDAKCWEYNIYGDHSGGTLGELIGGAVRPEVVGTDQSDKIHRLVPIEKGIEALKDKGININRASVSSSGNDTWKQAQKKAQQEKQIRHQAAAEI